MAKTKPIGVRFDEDMLENFKEDKIADSPQKALNFLYQFYIEHKTKLDYEKLFKESKLFNKPKTEVTDLAKSAPETNYPIDIPPEMKKSGDALGVNIFEKVLKGSPEDNFSGKKAVKTDKTEIERQLKEWQNKKCPSYMSLASFKKMQEKEIKELQSQLK